MSGCGLESPEGVQLGLSLFSYDPSSSLGSASNTSVPHICLAFRPLGPGGDRTNEVLALTVFLLVRETDYTRLWCDVRSRRSQGGDKAPGEAGE